MSRHFPVDPERFPFENYELVGHSGGGSSINDEAERQLRKVFVEAGLTKFEADVLLLSVGSGFGVREIERLTGVAKSVVSRAVQTAKAKLLAVGALGDWGASGSTARAEHEGVPGYVKAPESEPFGSDDF